MKSAQLNPVTIATIWHSLQMISRDMRHIMDAGGAFPGGYFPNGYDIHAEGICVPPIKIIEGGREREDIMELIFNNVRWPQEIRMDSYAMIAATKKAEERIIELLDKYGR